MLSIPIPIPISVTVPIVLPAIVLAMTAALAVLTALAGLATLAVVALACLGRTMFAALFGRALLAALALGRLAPFGRGCTALSLVGSAGLLALLAGLTLLLAIFAAFPALVALHEAAHGLDHAVIMIGVLVIGFGENAIAGRGRLAGQRLVLVEDLVRIATNPDVGAAAVENLVSIGRAVGIVVLGLVMVGVATAATATATAAGPLTIVWSH